MNPNPAAPQTAYDYLLRDLRRMPENTKMSLSFYECDDDKLYFEGEDEWGGPMNGWVPLQGNDSWGLLDINYPASLEVILEKLKYLASNPILFNGQG